MLANQYFMARRYQDALPILEQVILSQPENITAKKKLIICLAQNCKADRCLKLFYELIRTDINSILNTDPERDDCPCPELIYDYENSARQYDDLNERTILLGVLWLFCDLEMSIKYFKKAIEADRENQMLNSIYTILTSKYVKLKNEEN